jgi:hypothetical protein
MEQITPSISFNFWKLKPRAHPEHTDNRTIPKWYIELGFQYLISQFQSPSDIVTITKLPSEGYLKCLLPSTISLLSDYNERVRSLPFSLRAKFGSARNMAFNILQEKDTIFKYSLVLARFIFFVINLAKTDLPLTLPSVLKDMALALFLERMCDHPAPRPFKSGCQVGVPQVAPDGRPSGGVPMLKLQDINSKKVVLASPCECNLLVSISTV